ncbi:hypothetical protein, partial [Bradyrhizobium guangdongense]|uniref:hypothetical protein n=1 Tax=Bradyrhizobium guangdongense TaxID=1325090 RepID=UPI001AECEBFF
MKFKYKLNFPSELGEPRFGVAEINHFRLPRRSTYSISGGTTGHHQPPERDCHRPTRMRLRSEFLAGSAKRRFGKARRAPGALPIRG